MEGYMEKSELAAKVKEACYLTGNFILSSGKRSNYYLDKYRFSTHPELLGAVAEEIAKRVPPGVNRLAGPELGAVPIAAAVSLKTGIPYVIVKKDQKDYGTKRPIEGILEQGDNVFLIEDIITTATQCIRAAKRLVSEGAIVTKIIGVIDRQEGGAENIAEAGFDYEPLFTKEELGI
jgi:orotate phosphoribosyltransferase